MWDVPDILYLIFRNLDLKDIMVCARVNKLWYSVARSEGIWKAIFSTKYPWTKGKNGVSWRLQYKNRILNNKKWRDLPNDGEDYMQFLPNVITRISCLTFDEERNMLLRIGHDGLLECLDFNPHKPSIKPKFSTVASTNNLYCVRLFGDNVMTSGRLPEIKMWKLNSSNEEPGFTFVRTFSGHKKCVTRVQFDQEKMISCSDDCTLKMWDLERGIPTINFTGHSSDVWTLQYDDQRLISGSFDLSVKIWDLKTGKETSSTKNGKSFLRFLSFKDNTLYLAENAGFVRKFDVRKMDKEIISWNAASSNLNCVQFNEDHVWTFAGDCAIKIWTHEGKLIQKWKTGEKMIYGEIAPNYAIGGTESGFQFVHNGFDLYH